ncbi:TPA: hypothetical protein N0F65_006236 [Lagenidium giganteum]|uniref:BZIP domain-containing protein n=1 Tax=Lagenidium giganteum TaxID=4803 RepID=A0AAV2Z595_9STRA|nr:TPA: hypothetical protein N0F65_006236 [Lagenidium giganteum]
MVGLEATPASSWCADLALVTQAKAHAPYVPDATRAERRRQQVIQSARLNRVKKKRERDALVDEVEQLSAQVEALRAAMHGRSVPRGQSSSHGCSWQERSLIERRKLERAIQDNAMLRDALFSQYGCMHDLRSVFSSAPTYGGTFSLLEVLHTYTHLGSTSLARQRRLAQVCSDTQLALTQDIIRRETAHLDRCKPTISTFNWVTPDRFGANHSGMFVIDSVDIAAAFGSVRQAIKMASVAWPHHRQSAYIMEPITTSTDEFYYGRATVHYQHEHAATDDEDTVVGEDAIFFSRLTETYGIMLVDFVDADDLFPVTELCHFRRDMVGGVLVTLETCDDGVQRLIVRFVSTKCFQRSTFGLSPPVERFQDTEDDGRLGCSMSLLSQVRESAKSSGRL